MNKMAMTCAALAAFLAAPAAFSQQADPRGSATEPPGGAYRGYPDTRDVPEQQTAQVPSVAEEGRIDPGTLRKFNSNSGYGPEVQFDVDRREAAKRALEQRQQER
ncbi:MAG: hypothetical protein ACM31D_10920 [Bacteroidota bacterium]